MSIKGGKIGELFSCENFDFIKTGEYKGELLVSKSEIRDRGRDIYYHIVNWAGKSLHLFEGYDKYMEFRAKAI